jgi:1-deoxy-D-xylulose-5-phosphate reductoisomerase
MKKQVVTILGATGSIGLSTLDVMSRHKDSFELYAVSGNTNVEGMLAICQQYSPRIAVMADHASAEQLQQVLNELALEIEIKAGAEALQEISGNTEVTTVMAAIVGGAGLLPTLTAAQTGKRVLLANKESLVMSGDLLLNAAQLSGAQLLPVDSEHNAIFQSLPESVQKQH